MKKNKTFLLSLFSLLFMYGCDLIDYHPYDVDISGETGINAKNMAKIESNCKGKKTIKFAVMGDSQRWYDETEQFVKHINRRNDIDFVIHGGDVSDFGITKEFLWQRDILNGLKFPYVVIIGNHDVLGTGEEVYSKVFGEDNFSFIAGNVKFICLNTNAIEYDYSHPVPDFDFIENALADRKDEYSKTVFSMHVRPLIHEFNNNVAKVFHRYVKEAPGIQFCTAAHEHHLTAEAIFEDGIMYYGSDSMNHRSYLVFTINPERYEYEVVYF